MCKGEVEIIQDNNIGKRTIPLIVCYKNYNYCFVGWPAKQNMLQNPKSIMHDSKRLLGHKF